VTSLGSQLAQGLVEFGAPVRVGTAGRRANIVCIESRQGAAPVAELQQHLKECNVQAALRRNLVRFSFHFYNNVGDVDAALAACKGWLARHGDRIL
jgi:cysteine desulfurase / selenocysteine lyase